MNHTSKVFCRRVGQYEVRNASAQVRPIILKVSRTLPDARATIIGFSFSISCAHTQQDFLAELEVMWSLYHENGGNAAAVAEACELRSGMEYFFLALLHLAGGANDTGATEAACAALQRSVELDPSSSLFARASAFFGDPERGATRNDDHGSAIAPGPGRGHSLVC